MSMTSRVRFLDPVDPRLVWQAGAAAVNAPDPYVVAKSTGYWVADTEQGARAHLIMDYGPEGSLLRDDDDDEDTPPAYVEIRWTTDSSEISKVDHPYIVRGLVLGLYKIAGYDAPTFWWRDNCCDSWHPVTIMDATDGSAPTQVAVGPSLKVLEDSLRKLGDLFGESGSGTG